MRDGFGIDLDATLADVDALSRDAVRLVYLQKKSIAEVAATLGSTPKVVGEALMRGFHAVAQSIENSATLLLENG